jgi:hypothetical protein
MTKIRRTSPGLAHIIGRTATTQAGSFRIQVRIVSASILGGILVYQVTPVAGEGVTQVRADRVHDLDVTETENTNGDL